MAKLKDEDNGLIWSNRNKLSESVGNIKELSPDFVSQKPFPLL